MRLYRIAARRHISDLRGRGASFQTGGRWNRAGVPALYFAASAAVAMLEMAHYLPSPRLVPASYRMGIFEASDSLRMDRWTIDDLPADWRTFPYPASTQELGSTWLQHGRGKLLAIPSAAIPGGLGEVILASQPALNLTRSFWLRLWPIYTALGHSHRPDEPAAEQTQHGM